MIAVLAGNYQQYMDWKLRNPHVASVYCGDTVKHSGIEFSKIVEVGTFFERDDAHDIYESVLPYVRRK